MATDALALVGSVYVLLPAAAYIVCPVFVGSATLSGWIMEEVCNRFLWLMLVSEWGLFVMEPPGLLFTKW